jgi:hypothetical protein
MLFHSFFSFPYASDCACRIIVESSGVLERHAPGFDAAHIQNAIDDARQ